MHREHRHNLLHIDRLAQTSALNQMNPAYKMFVAILALLICVSFKSILAMGIIAVTMTITTVKAGKIKGKIYARLLLLPSTFIILSAVVILIQISGEKIGIIYISVGGSYLSITESSLGQTGFVVLRAYGALSCLYMMSLSTPLQEMIHVMRKFKIPDILIELMYLIYRYITILVEVHNKMTIAADSRLGYSNWKKSYKSMGGIASNLLVLAFRRASISFDAMEARGYNGRLEFWVEEKPLHNKEVGGAILYFFVIFLVMIVERIVL